MKALVVGYGSIGTRHARLLRDLGAAVAVVSRRTVVAARVYPTIVRAVEDFAPEYAVIASRTHEHRGDLVALAEAGFAGTVLVEKPLFERPCDVSDGAFRRVYTAYNLRFHPIVRRFKEILDEASPFAVHAYVGQYLPEFRSEIDYREGYRAKRNEGGGALRDLSHELDFLTWILGDWTRLTAAGGHFSDLVIDSDDAYSLIFETERCPLVTLNMNYIDSPLRRQILALTDKGTVLADLVAGTVAWSGGVETFHVERDDSYVAQHQAVLADSADLCTFDEGVAVVRMIEAAERASAERVWVAA